MFQHLLAVILKLSSTHLAHAGLQYIMAIHPININSIKAPMPVMVSTTMLALLKPISSSSCASRATSGEMKCKKVIHVM